MPTTASAALIVGAGPRLGAAIARVLGGQGRPLALVARGESKLADLGTTLRGEGLQVQWAAAEVAEPDSLRRAIDDLSGRIGPVDVAVHNVSVWRDGGVLDITPAQLFADLAVGAASLLTIAQAVAPGMIERGSGTILATGSMAADSPSPQGPSLGVQKASLRTLIRAMAGDLGPQGVHCATVTINGALDAEGFEPDRIAAIYGRLVAETAGPRETWRTLVDYPET